MIRYSMAVLAGAVLTCLFSREAPAQSSQAWKVTSRIRDVSAETRIGSIYFRVHGSCKAGGPYVVVGLEGYRGNALRKVDQVEQPVIFVAEGRDGARAAHRTAMFMFGDEITMPGSLPPSFVDVLAESDRF